MTLRYRVTIEDTDTSGLCPSSWENDVGKFFLADGKLVVEPSQRFHDLASASEAVRLHLRDFEIHHHLTDGRELTFEPESAVTVAVARGDHGRTVKTIQLRDFVSVTARIGLVRKPAGGQYPQPSRGFTVSDHVETAYRRWKRFLDGGESLQTTSYFILTLLERTAGGRDEAAKRFGVSRRVLNTLGRLSSSTGTPETARKADYRPMASEEEIWLRQAVCRIILKLGETDATPVVTMAELPSIGSSA